MNQIVYLTDVESGIQVEATLLRNPTALRLQDTETIWRITHRTLLEKAREREEAPVHFVEHGHWDWVWKYGALKRQGLFFGVEREGLMQGLMFLRFDKRARLAEQRGRTLVYTGDGKVASVCTRFLKQSYFTGG